MSNANLIAEARRNAPESVDESLIMRLVVALEATEKMAEAEMEDLADRGEATPPAVLLEVLPDSRRGRSDRLAIVTDHELPNLAGHLREDDEAHAGRWAYPFSRRTAALGAARRLVDENPGVYVLTEPTT